MMTNDTTPMKTCTNPECGETFPATAEYFRRKQSGKFGLGAQCKVCIAEYKRQYREANREQIAEYERQYRQANRESISKRERQYRIDNLDKEYERNRRWRQANPDKVAKQNRRYREANPNKEAERTREYREANRDELAERSRQYRINNPDKVAERIRRWQQANREKVCILVQRRRARKRGLPDTFTTEQWLQCLEYFNYTCPVCGNQLRDLFGNIKPHRDHWIPMSYEGDDNPGTVATNMICLCNDCNLSKGAKMPDIWLKQTFGTRKAKPIMARIEAYFAWCEVAA